MRCTVRGRRLAVISRFHFSKSRDIELRLRTALCLPASVLRPVRLGGDQERRRLQDVIPADTRGGGMAEGDRGSPGRENEGLRGRQTAIHSRGAFQSDRDQSISLDFHKFPYFTPLATAKAAGRVKLQRFASHHRHFLITNRESETNRARARGQNPKGGRARGVVRRRGQLSFRKLRCFH